MTTPRPCEPDPTPGALGRLPTAGDPRQDPREYRRALGQFSTGVTIITAELDGQLAGVTASSFVSVSLDPPLVLWAISKSSQSLSIFQRATHFAVNVLTQNQIDLASRFARSSADKFVGVSWYPGQFGAPLLPESAAIFECLHHSMIEAGDHHLLIGRVESFVRNERDLLLYAQGRFRSLTDEPATTT